jgi:thiamine-phosphate diphosphorylase
MLLFTPALCGARDPLAVLAAAFPHVDVVQIRPKPLANGAADLAPCSAAETLMWTRRALALRDELAPRARVVVDDRVDVALCLQAEGCDGVHLGQDDCPPEIARELLGPHAWIGWSTHDLEQVLASEELPLDYLGFGPVHATATKGYARGLGSEHAWIAAESSTRPLFAIGGIDRTNAHELARVGRAAVGSAILAADDPARAAREIRLALTTPDDSGAG